MPAGSRTLPQAKEDASEYRRNWWWISECQGRKPDQDLIKSQCWTSSRIAFVKGTGRDDLEALEMAMLISLVYNLAPGTARDMEVHLPESLCKSVRET